MIHHYEIWKREAPLQREKAAQFREAAAASSPAVSFRSIRTLTITILTALGII